MKLNATAHRAPRLVGIAALTASTALWLFTGRHFGWTQTSVVVTEIDPVTELSYPVRHPAFIAGLEVLALGWGLGLAALLLARLGRPTQTS